MMQALFAQKCSLPLTGAAAAIVFTGTGTQLAQLSLPAGWVQVAGCPLAPCPYCAMCSAVSLQFTPGVAPPLGAEDSADPHTALSAAAGDRLHATRRATHGPGDATCGQRRF